MYIKVSRLTSFRHDIGKEKVTIQEKTRGKILTEEFQVPSATSSYRIQTFQHKY